MLAQRLQLWNDGKILEIWKEGKTIQQKLQTTKKPRPKESVARICARLMFEGKVGPALKFLEEQAENGVLTPTDEIVRKLQALHPGANPVLPETLLQGPREEVLPAYFYSIDEAQIFKAASRTKGSGGPSLQDAQQWKRILCSNKFKGESKELREEIAKFARRIASETIDPNALEAYVAGRLIPLNKDPGGEEIQVRPIGVGEVMRRIVGKAISWCLREDIQEAAGPLQVSAGVKGGAEAAIHSMKEIYELESTDAVILVDAANAFNRLNRAVALHNVQYICPPFAKVLINTYRNPARLFIANGGEIESAEGTTQGCPLAMPFYGISITPIIDALNSKFNQDTTTVYQVWLADDATGAGQLGNLKLWWEFLIKEGERFGYFVKPSKSWLILKNPDKLQEAEDLFSNGSPINITTAGKRHLGAALGSEEFKETYIDKKVVEWCKRLQTLAEIAKSEPHIAYAAYVHGEQHRYTYFMRTINGISENLKPLDDIIENEFLPALFGRDISMQEREVLALPVKEGGLGIRRIHENASKSYQTSRKIMTPLINEIKNQSNRLPDEKAVKDARSETMLSVRELEAQEIKDVKTKQSPEQKRSLELLSEPGASSWLSALPIAAQGFNLNKGEFQDSLCLRYNMPLKNLPEECPCTKKYNVVHALNCHRGGFVNARHDNIRDLECKLLKVVCHDVESEPHLQKMSEKAKKSYHATAKVADDARPDIRARSFWRQGQNAFFDVMVTNADCESQKDTKISTLLKTHEDGKKRNYNRRVMEIEHGTFTPLIFTTSGVMGYECEKYHKTLAAKLSEKKGEKYEDVMRYLRLKLSFLALKSTLLCVRGSRSTFKKIEVSEDFAFSLDELGV